MARSDPLGIKAEAVSVLLITEVPVTERLPLLSVALRS